MMTRVSRSSAGTSLCPSSRDRHALSFVIGLCIASAPVGAQQTPPDVDGASSAAKSKLAAKQATEAKKIAQADRALRRAYQKEFAYLLAEKKALQARVASATAAAARRLEQQATQLATLEGAVMATTRRADAAEDALAKTQRETESQEDTASALESIRGQAAKAAGLSDGTSLKTALLQTVHGLRLKSRLHLEEQQFFSREGVQVKGLVANIGGMARFGVSGQAAGALAPAGDGAWKIWPNSDPQQARLVVNGPMPSTVGVFLAAKTDVAVAPPKAKTPLSIVRAGGTVAWVIVGLGFLGVLLALARLLVLHTLARSRRDLEETVFAGIAKGQLEAAMEQSLSAPGALARVLAAALQSAHRSPSERTDLIDERLLREQARADWFSSALIVVAAVAPLLGLLGTVTGMISTFDAITEVGTGDPRTLAGGISEALITTELGLIVAIPTLLLGNLLSGVGERFKQRLEISALAVQNRLEDFESLNVTAQKTAPDHTATDRSLGTEPVAAASLPPFAPLGS